MNVYGCDPLLTDDEIRYSGATPLLELDRKTDAVIIAVAHFSSGKCRLVKFVI